MDKVQIIILAGGLGKRMANKELPKALTMLRGRPLLSYLLESVKKSGVCPRPVIVVGRMAEKIRETIGSNYTYVFQPKPLGTGHAVMCAQAELEGRVKDILVLYADQPLISPATIKRLAKTHLKEGQVITVGIVKVPDFNNWRAGFYDFGRFIRNQNGDLKGIIEKKDASFKQLSIREINPGYYCFQATWLWQNLTKLKNSNAQKEYYLTDLIKLAFGQGQKIASIVISPKEALGVNTAEQLELAERII